MQRQCLRFRLSIRLCELLERNVGFAKLQQCVDERDAAVIRFGRQLFHDNRMDTATFAKAVQLFGKKGAMDLVAVMSTYAVSGFYATAVDEHMPAGRPDLERGARP